MLYFGATESTHSARFPFHCYILQALPESSVAVPAPSCVSHRWKLTVHPTGLSAHHSLFLLLNAHPFLFEWHPDGFADVHPSSQPYESAHLRSESDFPASVW